MQLRFALRNILRNPRRSFMLITTIGAMVFGVFMFDGFNQGIMHQYRTGTIKGLMGSGHVFQKGYRDETRDKPWEHWPKDAEKIRQTIRDSNLVVDAYPRIRFPSFLSNNKVNITALGEGIDASAEVGFFDALRITQGTSLTNEEDGIVLGDGLATALNVKVGDRVLVLTNNIYERLNGGEFKVVGVFFTGMKAFDDVYFRIQLKAAQNILETNQVEYFSIGLKNLDNWPAFAVWQTKNLPELQSQAFEEIDKVYYENSVKFLDSQFSLMLTIFLMIGILGVFNITSVSIFERTKELGILRANGESWNDIIKLVLTEVIIVSFFAGVFGIVLAYITNGTVLKGGVLMPPAPGFANEYYAQIRLLFSHALPCFVLGAVAAFLGALPPLWRLRKKTLAQTLRHV